MKQAKNSSPNRLPFNKNINLDNEWQMKKLITAQQHYHIRTHYIFIGKCTRLCIIKLVFRFLSDMSSSQKMISALFLVGLVVMATANIAFAAPSPLCEPGIIEEMPPHIKKVCLALENSNQLSNALSNYLKNEANALNLKSDDLIPSNFKRTDVDHVFLRFGRRR